LESLVEVRAGADPDGCRVLVESAAQVEPVTTLAHGMTIAESLLHRLAAATGRSETETWQAVLAEMDDDGWTNESRSPEPAPPKRARRRR
jgi:hypothetical protein